jgi:hypothetical protein
MTVDTYLETLTQELQDFCRAEGLPFESADELSCNPDITPGQRQWLLDFCARWDVQAERSQRT